MAVKQLRYVGPMLHADVPILNRQDEPLDEHGEGCLVRGEVFTCDADVAGRPPKLDKDGALVLGDDGQPVDPGDGLLAQVGVFELADAQKRAPRKRAAKKTVARKPDPEPPMPAASTPDTATVEV